MRRALPVTPARCLTIVALAGAALVPLSSGGVAMARGARGTAAPAQITNLKALTRLNDYSFVYSATSGSAKIRSVGTVHSLTDWKLVTGISSVSTTMYDVNGRGYSMVKGLAMVEHLALRTPQGYQHLNGEHTWGSALVAMTHVSGVRIERGGSCRVAGARGTIYDLGTPGVDKHIFSLAEQACVDDANGALLFMAEGIPGGSAARSLHLSGDREFFEVTSIGHSGIVRAPRAGRGR